MRTINTSGDIPLPRQFHSTVVYQGSIFLYGGYNGNDFSNFYEYQIKKKKWIKLQDSQENEGRRGHSAVVVGRWMCIHAGRDRDKSRNDVIVYDFEKKKWDKSITDVGNCSERYFHSICVWRGIMCLFGGLGINHKIHEKKSVDLNDFFMFGSEISIGVAQLIERVDDSSVTERSIMEKSNTNNNTNSNLANNIELKDNKEAERAKAKQLKFIRRHGLIGALLPENKQLILSFLDPISLCRMAIISKSWYLASNSEALWEQLFIEWEIKRKKEYRHFKGFYEANKEGYKLWQLRVHSNTFYWKEIYRKYALCGRGYCYIPEDRGNYSKAIDILNERKSEPIELKTVVVGGGGVGKSASVIRFVQVTYAQDAFDDFDYDPTIEDTFRRQVSYEFKKNYHPFVVLHDILDTAGPEEYSAMRDQWMRMADFLIITYSIAYRPSFDEVRIFVAQILRVKDSDTFPMILVGNKCDLYEERVVTTDEGIEFAKSLNIPFLETSAKTRINIDLCYELCVKERMHYLLVTHPSDDKKKKGQSREKEKCLMQ